MSEPLPAAAVQHTRRRLILEVLIVLGLSLGYSALRNLVLFTDILTRDVPLGEQTATIINPQSPRPWLDALYQLLSILGGLVPVALAFYLLWSPALSAWRRLGLDRGSLRGNLLAGLGLTALIGIPGLGLYFLGRSFGFTLNVVPTALDAHWWTVPILLLIAVRAAAIEEVIGVGYLFTRLQELGWRHWHILGAGALLRGTYHLYQGVGAFFGNAAMGLVFGWVYLRTGRLWPLLIAHFVIDALVFLGYPAVAGAWPELFGGK